VVEALSLRERNFDPPLSGSVNVSPAGILFRSDKGAESSLHSEDEVSYSSDSSVAVSRLSLWSKIRSNSIRSCSVDKSWYRVRMRKRDSIAFTNGILQSSYVITTKFGIGIVVIVPPVSA